MPRNSAGGSRAARATERYGRSRPRLGGLLMLSVGKLAAGPNAGRYDEDAVALGREDYYSSEGEWPGRWVGGGSDTLGLDGEVQDGDTVRLMSGEDPASGTLLGQAMNEGSVAGFDLTFNAPK